MLTGKPPITEIVLIPSTLASAIITNDAVLTAMPRSTFTVKLFRATFKHLTEASFSPSSNDTAFWL